MKRKGRLRGVTFFLAICAGVFSASFCVLLMAEEYHSARYKLDKYNLEFQGWEACKETKPAYYKANAEAVTSCLKTLGEAKDNFWVKLPKAQLAGLFALAALSSAAGGYLAARLVIWFSSLTFHRFIRWLGLCFRRRSEPKEPLPMSEPLT